MYRPTNSPSQKPRDERVTISAESPEKHDEDAKQTPVDTQTAPDTPTDVQRGAQDMELDDDTDATQCGELNNRKYCELMIV